MTEQAPSAARRHVLKQSIALASAAGLGSLALPNAAHAASTRPCLLGMVPFPPVLNTGWDAAYQFIQDHGDAVALYFQDGVPWPQALQSSDMRTYPPSLQSVWDFNRTMRDGYLQGRPLIVAFNPLDTTYRELSSLWADYPRQPLPEPWATFAFDHPNVKQACLNYCIALVEYYQPTFLAIGVETNILLARLPGQWSAYLKLHEFLYGELKRRYPSLYVFASIQYEHMLGLHIDSAQLAEQVKGFYPDVLRAEARRLMRSSDLVALSTYPFMVADAPLGPDWFQPAIDIAIELGKPIAIEQTGYTSKDVVSPFNTVLPGSELLQAQFLWQVLIAALQYRFAFVINFIPIDYGTNFGTSFEALTWANTGLRNTDGTDKFALRIWDWLLKQLAYTP